MLGGAKANVGGRTSTPRGETKRPRQVSPRPSGLHSVLKAASAVSADDDLAVLHVGDEARGILPHRRDRQLHLLVNVALEEARAVGRAVALLGQKVEGGGRDAAALALLLHLSAELAGVELRDLPDLVHRQRREDDDLVNAVAELRREAVLGGLHLVALDRLHVAQSLHAEAEGLFVLLKILRAE